MNALIQQQWWEIHIKTSNYPIETKLEDGAPVLIRLMSQDDKECLKIGFDKLSVNSRYYGIRKLIGYVLDENSSMLRILKHLGAQIRREDGTIQRVDLTLSSWSLFLKSFDIMEEHKALDCIKSP